VCYKLYIEERKVRASTALRCRPLTKHQSLEEIMQHMHDNYNFNPSKRAFQQQFRRWHFPSKQNPAHKIPELVARVKELWENNYTQRDMLKTLNDEGFELKERELMRLRAKHRLLLRIPNGMKQYGTPTEDMSTFQTEIIEVANNPIEGAAEPQVADSENTPQEPIQEVLRKRKERQDQRQNESDAKWASKKRRRRTKDYAGLPADPPGPPRFPSETTLDESKQFLGLDTKQYREVRDQFQGICEEEGVVKKTLAGPEKWQAVKERIIRENEALQAAFWTDKTDIQSKELALDVICTDVTKRMRTVGRRMTIIEAKNFLGLNPEESRQVRTAFYNILQADRFTSKIETGPEHWKELKDQWIAENPILQRVLGVEGVDPEYDAKYKALETLCRDVMKRLRDDQTREKTNPSKTTATPKSQGTVQTAAAAANMAALQEGQGSGYQFASHDLSDLQIDPSLLEAAGSSAPVVSSPTAIYLRPHAKSEVHSSDKMSLASLSTRTVQELHRLLQRKWPNATAIRVDGIEKGPGGQEISYLIEEDEELDAYLDHVKGRKAVFVVQLNRP
jgi:Clr5 domain